MQLNITVQNIITVAALVAALIALYKYTSQVVHWLDQQKRQDSEIQDIKHEQTLLVYGILACLKGLAEQGCDGPVHEAIDKIEKHINVEAHK